MDQLSSKSCAIFVLITIVVCFAEAKSWKGSREANRPASRSHQHSPETRYNTGDIVNVTDAFGVTRTLYVAGQTPVFTEVKLSDHGVPIEAGEDGELCNQFSSLEGHVGERAMCPWESYISRNASRIPTDILAVRCKCNGKCMSPTGPATCQPVYYNMAVQKMELDIHGRTKGGAIYTESIPVACVCAY